MVEWTDAHNMLNIASSKYMYESRYLKYEIYDHAFFHWITDIIFNQWKCSTNQQHHAKKILIKYPEKIWFQIITLPGKSNKFPFVLHKASRGRSTEHTILLSDRGAIAHIEPSTLKIKQNIF